MSELEGQNLTMDKSEMTFLFPSIETHFVVMPLSKG
jgi:hypothetical protein